DEAVLDVGVVLEKQRIGRATGLFKYLQSRRRRLVLFDCPFRIALAGPGHCPAFGRGANRIGLEAGRNVCHGIHLHQAKKCDRSEHSLHNSFPSSALRMPINSERQRSYDPKSRASASFRQAPGSLGYPNPLKNNSWRIMEFIVTSFSRFKALIRKTGPFA